MNFSIVNLQGYPNNGEHLKLIGHSLQILIIDMIKLITYVLLQMKILNNIILMVI